MCSLLQAGIQHKPPDIKMKASSLVRVNVQKDQASVTCSFPKLKTLLEKGCLNLFFVVTDVIFFSSVLFIMLTCEPADPRKMFKIT